MKTLISSVALALIIITSSSFSALVQQPEVKKTTSFSSFNYLRVHRMMQGAALSWAVSATDVVEFSIERSYDGEYFEPVTTVPYAGASMHTYKDMDVYPGTLSYRVVATKSDGSTEMSPVETVRIVKRR